MKVKAINPKLAFRSQLKNLRKEFQQETLLEKERAKVAAEEAKKALELEKKQQLLDIEKSKKLLEKQSIFNSPSSGASIFSASSTIGLVKDATVGAMGGEISNKKLVEETNFKKDRREIRFQNEEKRQQEISNNRLAKLIHLYQSAADFVTPSNLDAKINALFDQSGSITNIGVRSGMRYEDLLPSPKGQKSMDEIFLPRTVSDTNEKQKSIKF